MEAPIIDLFPEAAATAEEKMTDAQTKVRQLSPAAEVAAALQDGKTHLLLAASGSVATIKLPLIITWFANYSNLSIRVIFTNSAKHFLAGQAVEQPTITSLLDIPGVDGIYGDEDEWKEPWKRDGSILHIELRRWADILVVAPLSANTLAKITNGICDNLLTNVISAWDTDGRVDGRRKRILVAPAMNTAMWLNPMRAKQIWELSEVYGVQEDEDGRVESGWFEVLKPQEKVLACGETGAGGMMEWSRIVSEIDKRLERDLDPMRFPS